MDAYNRGYNASVSDTGDGGLSGTFLGTANILDVTLPVGFDAASFYAKAYQLADGTKVIAYRGTDQRASRTGCIDTQR